MCALMCTSMRTLLMRTLLTSMLITFFFIGFSTSLFAQGLVIVKVGSDSWKEISELSDIPANKKSEVIRILIGSDPDPDPDPDPDDLEQKVVNSTKKHLSKKEATALVLTLKQLAREDADLSKGREAVLKMLRVLEGFLDTKGRLNTWFNEVDKLGKWTSLKFLKTIVSGATKASDLESLEEGVLESLDDLKNIEERLDLPGLIALIKLILELLKDLGILGDDAEMIVESFIPVLNTVPVSLVNRSLNTGTTSASEGGQVAAKFNCVNQKTEKQKQLQKQLQKQQLCSQLCSQLLCSQQRTVRTLVFRRVFRFRNKNRSCR